ncbi:hypothetical protein LCGC14_2167920 [marine sediment metagenome]|uniref:Uncharacterized protein n=1 Tax=marine sediment metagenome TaxID=412755 RepID=A0A0F9ED37_9ZZZZ
MRPIKYYVGLFISFWGMFGLFVSDSRIIEGLSLLAIGAGTVLAFWGITQIRVKIEPLSLAEIKQLKKDMKKC